MHRALLIIATTGFLGIGINAGAQDANTVTVDGKRFDTPRRATRVGQLKAPTAPAVRRTLAQTTMPAHVMEAHWRRAVDLDRNGRVDPHDVQMVLTDWGLCPDCRTDLDGDGIVDARDLHNVLSRFRNRAFSGDETMLSENGYVQDAPTGLLDGLDDQAVEVEGGRVVRVEFTSQDAQGLRVQLDGHVAHAGIELRVYDPAGDTVFAPDRTPRLSNDGRWWSPTVFSDSVGLEFFVPAGRPWPSRWPEVATVAYLYCHDTALGGAGNCVPGTPMTPPMACHLDATCYSGWSDESDAVAVVSWTTATGCGFCTASLIGRLADDAAPLMITANHCISTQTQADSAEFYWFYETASCNGPPPASPGADQRTDGALLLKHNVGTDTTLLGLFEKPLGNYYMGWSTGELESGDAVTCLHHPRSTFMRIAWGTFDEAVDDYTVCDAAMNCFNADVWSANFPNGLVEPGSSGSGLLDAQSRIRGVLTGGPGPTCSGDDNIGRYGRFDLAYDQLLNAYVGSTPGSVYVNGAVAGDPGNNGLTELGTSGQPFNSVHEATYCVTTGAQVRIAPGNYDETVVIFRPMTLVNSSPGTILIGPQ